MLVLILAACAEPEPFSCGAIGLSVPGAMVCTNAELCCWADARRPCWLTVDELDYQCLTSSDCDLAMLQLQCNSGACEMADEVHAFYCEGGGGFF